MILPKYIEGISRWPKMAYWPKMPMILKTISIKGVSNVVL